MLEIKQKVLVGMSGGVDSSVSAVLLLEQGYEVMGAFMKNWSEEKKGENFEECGWKQERRDALRVAALLNIPFFTFDFEKDYRQDVVEYLFREYQTGRTPNPDVMCNKYVKFNLFIKEADRLGCDFVATGHYARIDRSYPKHLRFLAGKDKNKDQTYFLWAIDANVLPRILFPVGDMDKPEVRKTAKKYGLPVADKKDSTGICFVGEVDIPEFLQKKIPKDPGIIVTTEGKILGKHDGVAYYTIGQRHGLDVGGGTPYYVVEKRPKTKELVVSSNYDQALYKQELVATKINWFSKPKTFPFTCKARIRYRQPLEKCELKEEKTGIFVHFAKPQRAVTPGQSIVFYQGEEMLGGGIIDG